jgi:hypothetical protein
LKPFCGRVSFGGEWYGGRRLNSMAADFTPGDIWALRWSISIWEEGYRLCLG